MVEVFVNRGETVMVVCVRLSSKNDRISSAVRVSEEGFPGNKFAFQVNLSYRVIFYLSLTWLVVGLRGARRRRSPTLGPVCLASVFVVSVVRVSLFFGVIGGVFRGVIVGAGTDPTAGCSLLPYVAGHGTAHREIIGSEGPSSGESPQRVSLEGIRVP